MTTDDPRYARLPKWAQRELSQLRRAVEELREERDEARRGTDGPSRVVVHPYAEEPLRLHEHATVAFRVGESRHEEVHVRLGNGAVEVFGTSGLVLRGRAANLFEVYPEGPAR